MLNDAVAGEQGATPKRAPAGGGRRPWRRMFHRFAKSHYTHLATGVLLVLTAVLEMVDGALVDLEFKPESHHALLALGGVLMARSIVDILEGMEALDEASPEQDRAERE